MRDNKRVYTFGNGLAEGAADMRNLLGQGFSSEEVSRLMAIPLRGEMSLDQEMEGFSREISIYRR